MKETVTILLRRLNPVRIEPVCPVEVNSEEQIAQLKELLRRVKLEEVQG